ncbi:MAG TPA: LPXTG cell wall anchor domain-containing protein [Pseudonocardiaceae bacterium]|nr:LPXTG cell wall anchor domain-containing protein [Pseudonocardiaceae bacterium]
MSALITSRLLRATAIGLGLTMLTATAAFAAPPTDSFGSGDGRATAHPGNVTSCAAAHLPGQTITVPNLEDQSHKFVTVTNGDLPPGDEILAVVVKGGPGYNVYQGLAAYTALHAPVNNGGQIPTISHWFACVTHTTTPHPTTTKPYPTTTTTPPYTTTTETTTETTTTETTTTETTTPTTETTTPTTTGPHTTTTGAVFPTTTKPGTPGTTRLAFTGFGQSWLLWVGVLLLLAGGGFVAVHRVSRRRS